MKIIVSYCMVVVRIKMWHQRVTITDGLHICDKQKPLLLFILLVLFVPIDFRLWTQLFHCTHSYISLLMKAFMKCVELGTACGDRKMERDTNRTEKHYLGPTESLRDWSAKGARGGLPDVTLLLLWRAGILNLTGSCQSSVDTYNHLRCSHCQLQLLLQYWLIVLVPPTWKSEIVRHLGKSMGKSVGYRTARREPQGLRVKISYCEGFRPTCLKT